MRRGEPSMARASIVISPVAIVRVVKANRDLIAGVKVRLGRNAGGAQGWPPSTLRSRSQKRPGFPEFDLIWIALVPSDPNRAIRPVLRQLAIGAAGRSASLHAIDWRATNTVSEEKIRLLRGPARRSRCGRGGTRIWRRQYSQVASGRRRPDGRSHPQSFCRRAPGNSWSRVLAVAM
jgi:hypothetical protein